MDIITSDILWENLKHAKSWLNNLIRAGDARKAELVRALRDVIKAARETSVYMGSLKEDEKRNIDTEAHLAVLWTELGFSLLDILMHKLAKHFEIPGKLWANPMHFDHAFLEKKQT